MKRLIVGTLSFVLLSTVAAPVVQAETQAINSATFSRASNFVQQLTPFQLVTMAYQGHFTEQGIPSYMALIAAHQIKRVGAEQLVEAAIRANKLSPHLSTDREYLSNVKSLLETLTVR